MSAVPVLLDLRARGVDVVLDGNRLRCHARLGVLTADDRDQLRRHKPEIVALLAQPDALLAAEAEAMRRVAADEAAGAALSGVKRCPACRFERNIEIATCPVCHPAAWLPADCLGPIVCSVVGPCDRRAVGALCHVPGVIVTPTDAAA